MKDDTENANSSADVQPEGWDDHPEERFVPLNALREHGIRLTCQGSVDADLFQQLFEKTWRRMPQAARQVLLQVLRETMELKGSVIKLVGAEARDRLGMSWNSPLVFAQLAGSSMVLHFFSPMVEEISESSVEMVRATKGAKGMPESPTEAAEAYLAQGLAKLFLWATKADTWTEDNRDLSSEAPVSEEDKACEVRSSWGFGLLVSEDDEACKVTSSWGFDYSFCDGILYGYLEGRDYPDPDGYNPTLSEHVH